MGIEPKYSLDNPPGTLDRRVFIGGNYNFGSRLEDIADAVRDCEYIPIIAWDFGIPHGTERHSAREIIQQCKYAIFEVSSPAGHFLKWTTQKHMQPLAYAYGMDIKVLLRRYQQW